MTEIYLIVTMLIIAFVFFGVILKYINTTVLHRLHQLSTSVRQIGISGNITEQIAITGSDELSNLSEDINRMLNSLEKSRQLLQNSYEHMKLLLASISQVIIGVDSEGRINQWNAAAEKTFGIAEAEVTGKPFTECGIQWNWGVFKAITSKTEDPLDDEIEFIQPNGKEGIFGFNVNGTSFEAEALGYILVGIRRYLDEKNTRLR